MKWPMPFFRRSRSFLTDGTSLVDGIAEPGRHETRIHARFGGKVHFEGEAPEFDRPLVIVAFTNRSGSNLLADYVRQAGRVAACGEFLNRDIVAKRAKEHGIETFPDYIRQLAAQFAGPQKSLGLKASWDQMAMLLRWNIPAMFPGVKVLHPVRHDLMRQAISYLIALETGRWTSRHKGSDRMPDFDPAEITRVIRALDMANRRIQLISEAHGMPHWAVFYENMCRAPHRHLAPIFRKAELADKDWKPRKPGLVKQADERNEAMARAFLAHLRDQV